MTWSPKETQRAQNIIATQIAMRSLRSKTNRSMAAATFFLLIIGIGGFWMGVQIKAAKDMGSVYVMVDRTGTAIENIPLSAAYPSRSETELFIEQCIRMMFDIDALSFREQIVTYLSKCMTIRDGRDFTETFRDSGFLELVQAGAVLDVDIRSIDLVGQQIQNGVRFIRFDLEGVVYLQRQQTQTTPLSMSVVIKRQDLRRYQYGITISQVVWS